MAKKRMNVVIQEEILRLKGRGHSKSEVARLLNINRETVRAYWNGPPPANDLQIPEWVKNLDWEHVNKEINSKVPKKILYEELQEVGDLPSYQAFCQYLRNNREDAPEVTIKIHRRPGDSAEVDYSGDSIQILNPATGELLSTELFVGALSYSGYIYAEFTFTQRIEDFVGAQNNMLFFFGGVPRYIVPDNCKTAVIRPDRHAPTINATYQDFCKHYGMAIDPADVCRPTHKPNVEAAIGITQRDFFSRIRNKTFTSLSELNKELKNWLVKINNDVMKERGKSRKEFLEKELSALSKLPASAYEIFYFKKGKVHPDCHIQHERNFYSVPHLYVGKEVDIRFNAKMLYAYYQTKNIAVHQILKGHTHYSTIEDHYPEQKIVDINFHIQHARAKAKNIGPHMEGVIEKLMRTGQHPLKALRKIQGILGLENKYNKEQLEYGAEMAFEFDKLTYRHVSNYASFWKVKKDECVNIAPIRNSELICLQGGICE